MDQEQIQDKIRQGIDLMSLQKYAEAEELFSSLAEQDPRNVEVYINLANAQIDQEKVDEGIATLKRALLVDENNAEVLYDLGCAYFLKVDYAHALRYFNLVERQGEATVDMYSIEAAIFVDSDDYNMAIRSINRAIELEPLNAQLRLDKAQVYEEQGRVQEAVATLHELEELLPDEGSTYAYEARLLTDAERYDDALQALQRAQERFPEDPTIFLLKARALNDAGRYEEALSEAMRGEELVRLPGDEQTSNDLKVQTGIALGGMGRVEESLAVMDRAAREGGGTGTYFLALNECLALRRYERVVEYADRILAQEDVEPRVLAAAIYYKPFALEKLGRMEEARPLYEEAVGQLRRITIGRPALYEVYAYRTMTYRSLGRHDDALELADYLVSLDDTAAASQALRYEVLKAKGDMAEAAKARARVLSLDPQFKFGE